MEKKRIETEIWEPNSEKKGQVRFVKTRTAYEVFEELKKAMEDNNMMPDEYFCISSYLDERSVMPRDAQFIAYAQWGGSEGVYIDVEIISPIGKQRFATGKTLGETEADFDRMQEIAGFIYKTLSGFGRHSENEHDLRQYVVCFDRSYVRDAQRFDTSELSDEDFKTLDIWDVAQECHWRDFSNHAFVAVVQAHSEEEACVIAANEHWYDHRQLLAIDVQALPKRKEKLFDAMLNHISKLVGGTDLVDTLHAIGFTNEEIQEEGFSLKGEVL